MWLAVVCVCVVWFLLLFVVVVGVVCLFVCVFVCCCLLLLRLVCQAHPYQRGGGPHIPTYPCSSFLVVVVCCLCGLCVVGCCVCVLCVVLLLSVCVLRLHAFYTEGFVEFTGAFFSSGCHLAPTLRSTYRREGLCT